MLYVGHFSFYPPDAQDPGTEIEEGSFTCLVEAESAEAAVDKLRDLIHSLDDSFERFRVVGDVYLDDITEVRKLPEQGVLARYEERMVGGGTIATSLPGVPPEYCATYAWGDEGQGDEEAEGDHTAKPFVYLED
ncbi:MAG: hypothetical protein M3R38_02345 [Actinomycetota bacterium]|nr:hypothetical protein [Actinomycetota bacterium]